MKYTNSSLVTYINLADNYYSTPRPNGIDTITIHCFVGQVTAKRGCDALQHAQASANYVVGKDGDIGLFVEEKHGAWTSSNKANDLRAVTIEVASDTKEPYKVKDAAYKSLIKLVADICKRNNIKKLVWSTKKEDRVNHKNGCNMTIHRDYANKSCPGTYLYNKMEDIATKVNAKLKVSDDKGQSSNNTSNIVKPSDDNSSYYKIEIGPFKDKSTAKKLLNKLQLEGNSGKIVSHKKEDTNKDIETVAREVIQGKWDNGTKRKENLEKAGYNYSDIQNIVNKLLK